MATALVSSFYFNGLHETIHRTAFRFNFCNDAFAHIFGFLCLRPARHYYHYHWQHHRYTGNPKLDSELQPGLLDFPVDNVARYALYLSGIPFWGDAILTTTKHAFGKCDEAYLTNERAKREVTREARIYLALYACIAAWGFCGGGRVCDISAPSILGAAGGARPAVPPFLLACRAPGQEGITPDIREHADDGGDQCILQKVGVADAVPCRGGDDILDSGEMHSELQGSGRDGYLNFNRRFVGLLRHQSSNRL